MKKTTIISLVSIICLTLLITCTSFDPAMFQKKPTIQFHSFQFKEITLNDMTTLFSIEIENPYPITLYVDSIQSQIYIDSHSLLVLQSTDSLKLPKHSKTIKTFATTITCLLYTSDAADDYPCFNLGGRPILQKKNNY